MDWLEVVKKRLKNGNAILFSPKDECLKNLSLIVSRQSHKALILWALELAEEGVKTLENKYPKENSPRLALEFARAWSKGDIKMPLAKRAILNCHAFCKKISNLEDIAICHAVGQACAVVHTPKHALGYPIYELTSIVRRYGIKDCKDIIEKRINEYCKRLEYLSKHYKDCVGVWAKFIN